MGQAIGELASETGVAVQATLGRTDIEGDPVAAREVLSDVDVALEFTTPDSAVTNIHVCIEAGCPVVVGTTGWYDHLDAVTSAVTDRRGALLWAPNFSLGAAALGVLARVAGELLARADGFDTHLLETHHTGKRDAPSGTALALEASLSAGLGRATPITSIRTGSVPGTHEIVIDGPFEQLTLRHEARDRRVFADGALRAAAWLPGRVGVFTMEDVLRGDTT